MRLLRGFFVFRKKINPKFVIILKNNS